jgi:hypothetical protein
MSSLDSARKRMRPISNIPASRSGISDTQKLIRIVHAEMGIIATTPPHAMKYPKHQDKEKGSVWRGLCNRTACDGFPAQHYNLGTYGYYCAPCAHAINRGHRQQPLCIEVDHSLSLEEMDRLYRDHHAEVFK